MGKNKVIKLIREELRQHKLGDISFDVMDSEITKTKDDFWYVPVQPSSDPPSTFQYYEVLAEVETELSARHHLKVLLVPELAAEN